MASSELEFDVLRDLLEEAEVADALAKDEQSFLGAYQAFRALDPKAFQGALQKAWAPCPLSSGLSLDSQQGMHFPLPRTVRTSETVPDRQPHPRLLAEAVVRITKDTKALDQLVEAVEKRDHAASSNW